MRSITDLLHIQVASSTVEYYKQLDLKQLVIRQVLTELMWCHCARVMSNRNGSRLRRQPLRLDYLNKSEGGNGARCVWRNSETQGTLWCAATSMDSHLMLKRHEHLIKCSTVPIISLHFGFFGSVQLFSIEYSAVEISPVVAQDSTTTWRLRTTRSSGCGGSVL